VLFAELLAVATM